MADFFHKNASLSCCTSKLHTRYSGASNACMYIMHAQCNQHSVCKLFKGLVAMDHGLNYRGTYRRQSLRLTPVQYNYVALH